MIFYIWYVLIGDGVLHRLSTAYLETPSKTLAQFAYSCFVEEVNR